MHRVSRVFKVSLCKISLFIIAFALVVNVSASPSESALEYYLSGDAAIAVKEGSPVDGGHTSQLTSLQALFSNKSRVPQALQNSLEGLVSALSNSLEWNENGNTIARAVSYDSVDLASLRAVYEQFKAQHLLYLATLDRHHAKLERLSLQGESLSEIALQQSEYLSVIQPLVDFFDALYASEADRQWALSKFFGDLQGGYDLSRILNDIQPLLKRYQRPILGAQSLPSRGAQITVAPLNTGSISPSYSATPISEVTAGDLVQTTEVVLTHDILTLARELEYDPANIYEYVRNNIKLELYSGSMKGSQNTLASLSGNSVDQSSLLIALYRASSIPARYAHGVVEMPVTYLQQAFGIQTVGSLSEALRTAGIAHTPIIRGGQIDAFDVEHTFVVARVPYANYRGAAVDDSGQVWLPLMPAVKTSNVSYLAAEAQAVNVDVDSVFEAFVSGPQTTTPLDYYEDLYQTQLTVNDPSGTLLLSDVRHQEAVQPENIEFLPNSTPLEIKSVYEESASLSDDKVHRVEFTVFVGDSNTDQQTLQFSAPLSELDDERITFSYIAATNSDQITVNGFGGLGFTPAYLVNVRPVIKVGGKSKSVGERALPLGQDHLITVTLSGPGYSETFEKRLVSGGYHAAALSAQDVVNNGDEAGQEGDSEYRAARILSQMALNYLEDWDRADQRLSSLANIKHIKPVPSLVFVGNQMSVARLLTQPQSVDWAGVEIDALARISNPIARTDTALSSRDWRRLSGLHGSFLEHWLLQADFGVGAVSADKVLAQAAVQGTQILDITPANRGTTISSLALPQNVIDDLNHWLDRGFHASVPVSEIAIDSWAGAGWIVENSVTGEAGYFLSGGIAGGSSTALPNNWPADIRDALSEPYVGEPNEDPLSAASISILASTDQQIGVAGMPSDPAAVIVRDAEGRGVANASVTFTLVSGDGQFSGAGGVGSTVATVNTDYSGMAAISYTHPQSTSFYRLFGFKEQSDEYRTQMSASFVTASVSSAEGDIATRTPITFFTGPDEPVEIVNSDGLVSPAERTIGEGQSTGTIYISIVDQYNNPVSNENVSVRNTSNEVFPGPLHDPAENDEDNSIAQNGALVVGEAHENCPGGVFAEFSCASSSQSFMSKATGTRVSFVAPTSAFAQNLNLDYMDDGGAGRSRAPYFSHIYSQSVFEISAASDSLMLTLNGTQGVVDIRYLYFGSAQGYDSIEDVGEVYPQPLGARIRWNPNLMYGDPLVSFSENAGQVLSSVVNAVPPDLVESEVTLRLLESPGANRYNIFFDYLDEDIANPTEDDYRRVVSRSPSVIGGRIELEESDPGVEPPSNGDPLPSRGIELDRDGGLQNTETYRFTYEPSFIPTFPTFVITEDGADFFEGPVTLNAVPGAPSAEGIATIPAGLRFDVTRTYQAQVFFNKDFESGDIASNQIVLPIRSPLLDSVSGSIEAPANATVDDVSLRFVNGELKANNIVDLANETTCYGSAFLKFRLTAPADMTLELFAGTSSVARYTVVEHERYERGDNNISVSLAEVQPGFYTYRLTAVPDSPNLVTEIAEGVAYFRNNYISLPIGHSSYENIDLFDGSMSLSRTDISLPGRGKPIDFRRNYNSSSTVLRRLGIGWSHSYDSKITSNGCGGLVVTGGDGGGQTFRQNSTGDWEPQKGYHGSLVELRTGYDFYSKDGTRYHFRDFQFGLPNEWYLESITDLNGNSTTLAYDPTSGREPQLTTIESGDHRLTLEYENITTADGRGSVLSAISIISLDSQYSQSVQYAYDEMGRLLSAVYTGSDTTRGSRRGSRSRTETYEYKIADYNSFLDAEGEPRVDAFQELAAISRIIDFNGNTTDYTSDVHEVFAEPILLDGSTRIPVYQSITKRGRTQQEDSTIDFAFSPLTRENRRNALPIITTTVTDPRNNVTEYVHDGYGVPRTITSPAGTREIQWETETDILLLSQTDENGIQTRFEYDEHGNKTAEWLVESGIEVPNSRMAWEYYSPPTGQYVKNRINVFTDRRGNDTEYFYDSQWNLSERLYPAIQTTAQNLPIAISVPQQSNRSERFTYYPNGDRASYTDLNGNITTYEYNEDGLVSSITERVGGEDAENYLTQYTYSYRGLRTSEVNPAGQRTNYNYDGLGNLVEVTLPDQSTRTYVYDNNGNKTQETDEENQTTDFEYDTQDRLIAVTNAEGRTRRNTYDRASNLITSTRFRLNTTTTYGYDNANRLTSESGPEDYTLTRQYDGVGNITEEYVTTNRRTRYEYDAFNRRVRTTYPDVGNTQPNVETITYDGNGNITQTVDPNGNVVNNIYDERDRLVETRETFTDSNGQNDVRTRGWVYDDNNNVIYEIDANGGYYERTYDELDRLLTEEDPVQTSPNPATLDNNVPRSFVYDRANNITREIDRRGFETRHEYDRRNRVTLTTISGAVESSDTDRVDGITTTYDDYDDVGNLIQKTLPNGNVVNYRYDGLHRLIETRDSLGLIETIQYDFDGNKTDVTNARGFTTQYTYDNLGRVTEQRLPDTRRIQTTYDIYGNIETVTDARGNTTTYDYDALNRQIEIEDPAPFNYVATMTYDNVGNRTSETDRRGNTTTYIYDELNRLIQTRTPDISGGVGVLSETREYDEYDNLIALTDKRGFITRTYYDANNRVVSIWREDGGDVRPILQSRNYDAEGNIRIETDAEGNSVSYFYDARGLLLQESRPEAAVSFFEYDAMGNLTLARDPELRNIVTTYDLRNRKDSETLPSRQSTSGGDDITEYAYDGVGNLTEKTRPSGDTWIYTYDSTDRLIEVEDPAANRTTYAYNNNDSLISQTDAEGDATTFEYDEVNRRTLMTYADNATVSYDYDANGNLTDMTDANGRAMTYAYDEINRETTRTFEPGPAAIASYVISVASTYDANNNLTDLVETYSDASTRSYAWDYDLFDRNTHYTDAFGQTNVYAYNHNGFRTRLTDPDGAVTNYIPDRLNRVVSVTNNAGVTNYRYYRDSQIHTVRYPNSIDATYTYDDAGRVQSIINRQNGGLLSSYTYAYDANSNRSQQIETNGGSAETTTYNYDGLDRLTQVVYPDITVDYTYYDDYNRDTEIHTLNSDNLVVLNRDYDYNTRNQLTDITDLLDATQNISYGYDANGNQISKLKEGITSTYLYDARDDLRQVTVGGSTVGQFLYDAQGLRTEKIGDRGTERYTYDDQSILLQTDAAGTTLAKYEYGPDRLLSLDHTTEGRQYYLTDALNSVVNLANEDGSVQARYQYDAWGNKRTETGDSWNRFSFTGYEEDTETGLLYAKARYYDPDVGLFISQDAWEGDLNIPPSLNKYLYAYSNPTYYVDPDGNFPVVAEMAEHIHGMAADMRSYSMDLRNSGNRTRAILTEGVSIFPSLVGGAVSAINYGLDSHMVAKADSLERQYGHRPTGYALDEARANVAAIDGAIGEGLKNFTTRDGRSKLGTPLVEWAHDFAAGGDLAAQKGITGFGEMLAGGALARMKVKPKITVEDPSGPGTTVDNSIPAELSRELDGGGSYLMKESDFKKFAAPAMADGRPVGRPDGQFMTSSKEMNAIIDETNGNSAQLGQKLGVDGWEGEKLIRMDVENPNSLNPRLPDSSISGANDNFVSGGKTSGGVSELVTDPIPADKIWATELEEL